MLDPSSAILLDVSHVSQTYSKGSGETGAPVLQDVSLSLRQGEIVSLLGRSGCGKSTLLRIISGLSRPTEGHVSISGAMVDGPAEGVAMVFQSFALFPWLSVLDNVEIGLRAQGVPQRRDAQARACRRSTSSASTASNPPIRRSSRAACANASASPARWSCSRRSC